MFICRALANASGLIADHKKYKEGMKINILILIFILSFCTCNAQSVNKRISDIEFIKSELPKLHCNLFYKTKEEVFINELDTLESYAGSLTDLEFALRLQKILTKLGDAHTNIDFFKFINQQNIYPIELYWFKDGFYVIAALKNYKNILGHKLYSINRIPVNEIMRKFESIIVKDNDAMMKHRLPELIVIKDILDFLKITNNKENTFVFIKAGKFTKVKLSTAPEFPDSSNYEKLLPREIPISLKNKQKLFRLEYLKEKNIIYAQYNRCWSRELEALHGSFAKAKILPSFEEFSDSLISQIYSKQPSKLIFDLRFNPGGSSLQGTHLVEKISKINEINKKGKLFVIIGRTTFSSAVINAIDFRQKTNAILIGEETSGTPNHFGEIKTLTLPNSNIQLQYSTKYFRLIESDNNTVQPDIMVSISINDFLAGKDPALDYIFNFSNGYD